MAKTNVILHGGGGHGSVVLDCLLSIGVKVSGIYDPLQTGVLFGIPFLGSYDARAHADARLIIAIGDNQIRSKLATQAGHAFANAIHGSAVISSFCSFGLGNMILHGSIIQAKSVVGNHVIVNSGAQIDHDCSVADFVHVGPGSILCGGVSVGEGAFIGAGSVVIPGIQIGAWATIGAGSVVTRNIPDFAVAVGSPARIMKYKG